MYEPQLDTYVVEKPNSTTEQQDKVAVSDTSKKSSFQMRSYGEYRSITRENILAIINEERNKAKYRSLAFDYELNLSAQKKAEEMLTKSYFSHETPDGKNFTYFIDYAGYEFLRASENLAQGDFSSSRDIVLAWMNSPTHKQNIFDDTMTDTGIGITFGMYKGREGYFIVQHFGRPRGACPLVERGLEAEIKIMNERGKGLYSEIKKLQGQVDAILNNNPGISERASAKKLELIMDTKIAEYNTVVDTLNELTKKYNDQVKLFNACTGV